MSRPEARPNYLVLGVGGAVVLAFVALFYVAFASGIDPNRIDSPLVEKPAPPFDLPALDDDRQVTLAELQGKPAVINFWATWCASCPMEHPTLVQAARYYGGRVQFVGIAYEDKKARIKGWLKRYGGEAYPTLIDKGGKTAIAYGVYGVPETYIVDAQGVIRYKHVGPIPPAVLQAELNKLL